MPEDSVLTYDTVSGSGPVITRVAKEPRSLKLQIFEAVRASGTKARVDLARELQISPATVTALSADLIDGGLIVEVDAPRPDTEITGRGRPRVALGVNGEAGYVIGIKISDRKNTAVVTNLAGDRIAEISLPAPAASRDSQSIIHEASALVAAAQDAAGFGARLPLAVGIGMPGVVDNQSGRIFWSPIITERDVALGARLSDTLGIPVRIDNDANLLTMAEMWFGAGRATPNFAVVSIEHGVGMGLVIDHEIYRGANGLGLELGHMKIQLDGALCRCGQRGCLEAYVADYALVREASTALNYSATAALPETTTLEALFSRAKEGNIAARAIFQRAGRYLAAGLANVITLFDPEVILLSGERMRYDLLYAEDVLSDMRTMLLDTGREPPKVEIHVWGDLIWAQGASALALEYATRRLLA